MRRSVGRVRKGGVRCAALACFGATLVGCAGNDGAWRPPPDAPKIGLMRGAAWSLMTLAPPSLVGNQFNMRLERGVLSGTISGGDAPGGGVHVEIKGAHAEGFGPHGPVNIEVRTEGDKTVVDGMWNGARVHLAFSSTELRGTVASNSAFNAKTNAIELFGMETFRRGPRANPMADQIDPLPQNVSCEYFLREKSVDGALNGGSICGGMPQDTRLEVPVVAQKWFTQTELFTVLVAVLSSPPPVNAERYGPRFRETSPMYNTGTAGIDTRRN